MGDTYRIYRKRLYKYIVVDDLFTEKGTPYRLELLNTAKPYFLIMGNPVDAKKTLDVDMTYEDKDTMPSCADCNGKIEWESDDEVLNKTRDWAEIPPAGSGPAERHIQDIGHCVGCQSLYFDQGARDRFDKERLDGTRTQGYLE